MAFRSTYDRPIRPVDKKFPITLEFGALYSDETVARYRMAHKDHWGTDFGCPIGTPVLAVVDAVVYFAGYDKGGWGNNIVIQSGTDYYIYAHLSQINVVVGQKVTQGQAIGLSGNTSKPDMNTEEHLHFEHRKGGATKEFVAPILFFNLADSKERSYYS